MYFRTLAISCLLRMGALVVYPYYREENSDSKSSITGEHTTAAWPHHPPTTPITVTSTTSTPITPHTNIPSPAASAEQRTHGSSARHPARNRVLAAHPAPLVGNITTLRRGRRLGVGATQILRGRSRIHGGWRGPQEQLRERPSRGKRGMLSHVSLHWEGS